MTTHSSFHTYSNDTLGKDDAVALCNKIHSKEIHTDELVCDALARASAINPKISAFNYLHNDEFKVNKSNASNVRGTFFSGLPSVLKDNVMLKGMPTTFGTAAFEASPDKKNSPFAAQFQKMGFRILGKSALPEFGFNATTEPIHTQPTRNPWNPNFSSGASSGGAAALVAAGVVPFAHGNDGGGSIRIPAACCGLVGLKPSRGRHVNEYIASCLPINIVSEGILSRSVRDTAYYHFEAQKIFQNPKLPSIPLITAPSERRLKIGVYIDSVTGYSTDQDTRAACLTTAELLAKAGHHVEEMRFPVTAQFAQDFSQYWGMLAFMVKKTGSLTLNRKFDSRKMDSLSHGLANHFRRNMMKAPLMIARLKQHGQMFQSNFNRYDVYLSPVTGQTARPLGELKPAQDFSELFDRLMRYASFTPMANIAGTPAISIPAGKTKDSIPIGVQLSAALGNEQILLELAYELEALQPWPLLGD